MISQTVEYALRAIMAIAQHGGQPCTARQISEATQVPAPYLSKLMQGLVHKGLVRSQRGWHGGFVLTKEPQEISVWDIVNATMSFRRIRQCPLEIKSHRLKLCSLHRCLDEAIEMVEESFRRTTIEDILHEPNSVTPSREDPPPTNTACQTGHRPPEKNRKK